MAVWWVDPYSDANIGGIHGTVNTTTRNGTYAYPFKFSDVVSTTSSGLSASINGNTISSGDEFRFKGLANREAFLVDVGNTWYHQYGYRMYYTGTNTALTNLGSSWPSTAGVWGRQTTFVYDPAVTDLHTIKSAGNFKPLLSQKYHNAGSYWELRYSYNLGYTRNVLYRQYPSSSYDDMQLYALDPDYIVPYGSSDDIYFLCLTVPITVTDGWTSETTRNGYNFIRIGSTSTSTYYFYFNPTSNTNANSNTIYDMPDTGWDFHGNGSGNTNPNNVYYYINSATDTGASVGYSYTQKPGSLYSSQQYSSYVMDYTGQYYHSSTNQSTSCNSADITCAMGTWFQTFGRYASSTPASYPTKTIRNIFTSYYPRIYSSYGYSQYYNIGTVMMTSPTNNAMLSLEYSPGGGGWIKFLDGAHYGTTSAGGPSVLPSNNGNLGNNWFVDSVAAFANTEYNAATHINNSSATIYNYTNDSSSSWPLASSYQYPEAIKAGGGSPGLSGKVNYAGSNWWTAGYVKGSYIYNNTQSGAYVISQSLGVLDMGGADYTASDCTINIETDAYMYSSNTAYLQYPSFHFSRNTYDGKPITILPAVDDVNANVACIGYNNDSNGFCVQSNPNDNGDYFGKDFEIALPTYDPSSQNIRIDCTYRFEDLNGNGINTNSYMYYYYSNSSGGHSYSSTTLYEYNTSNTTAQTTITGSNMAQGDDKRNHIIARLQFRNQVGNTSTPDRGRLVIVSLTATAV